MAATGQRVVLAPGDLYDDSCGSGVLSHCTGTPGAAYYKLFMILHKPGMGATESSSRAGFSEKPAAVSLEQGASGAAYSCLRPLRIGLILYIA